MQENFYDFAKMTLAVRRSRFRFSETIPRWKGKDSGLAGQCPRSTRPINRCESQPALRAYCFTPSPQGGGDRPTDYPLPLAALGSSHRKCRIPHARFFGNNLSLDSIVEICRAGDKDELAFGCRGKRTRTHRSGCDTHAVTMTVGDVAGSQKPPAESRLFLLAEAPLLRFLSRSEGAATSGGRKV